jgi:hypothetical protein
MLTIPPGGEGGGTRARAGHGAGPHQDSATSAGVFRGGQCPAQLRARGGWRRGAGRRPIGLCAFWARSVLAPGRVPVSAPRSTRSKCLDTRRGRLGPRRSRPRAAVRAGRRRIFWQLHDVDDHRAGKQVQPRQRARRGAQLARPAHCLGCRASGPPSGPGKRAQTTARARRRCAPGHGPAQRHPRAENEERTRSYAAVRQILKAWSSGGVAGADAVMLDVALALHAAADAAQGHAAKTTTPSR